MFHFFSNIFIIQEVQSSSAKQYLIWTDDYFTIVSADLSAKGNVNCRIALVMTHNVYYNIINYINNYI